eukprot:6005631-Amphidinium_carterae.1
MLALPERVVSLGTAMYLCSRHPHAWHRPTTPKVRSWSPTTRAFDKVHLHPEPTSPAPTDVVSLFGGRSDKDIL